MIQLYSQYKKWLTMCIVHSALRNATAPYMGRCFDDDDIVGFKISNHLFLNKY